MSRLAGLLALSVLIACAGHRARRDCTFAAWDRPRIDPLQMTKHALFSDSRLWLLSDDGELFSLGETDRDTHSEPLGAPAMDICLFDGHIAALTYRGDTWELEQNAGSGWKRVAEFGSQGEPFFGLVCSAKDIHVLTPSRVLSAHDGQTSIVPVRGELRGGLVTVMARVDNGLYFGTNRGEWGGELSRIDLVTGAIEDVDAGGPVNALVQEPWRPECLLASVGLVHFFSSGALVEVCGTTTDTIAERPLPQRFPKKVPQETVSFFGAARDGKEIWAAGYDGLYRVTPLYAERRPLPKFRNVGELAVSFDVPGLILVLTETNRRVSVSGAVPLIMAR